MLRRAVPLLALAGATLAIAACGGGGGSTSTGASLPSGCEQVSKPPPQHRQLKKPKQTVTRGEKLTATVDTSCGRFEIQLDTSSSPKTVNSFAYLSKKGLYDDTTFNRIVPHFVIQGGDPLQNGSGGPGYSVVEPPPQNASYQMGTVAMAKTAVAPRGQSGSQFFVVTAADAGLPPNYAILGKVISGMDVVKRIGTLGDPASGDLGTPLATVVIRRISVSGG
ncbi:MAG TPA: peptidylprolyl isomerase [Solirubrobacterales bacterium]|nr:peptidylprolyl isomerase [Solirubrobacterales bacterium]